jgi:hypothetical protein
MTPAGESKEAAGQQETSAASRSPSTAAPGTGTSGKVLDEDGDTLVSNKSASAAQPADAESPSQDETALYVPDGDEPAVPVVPVTYAPPASLETDAGPASASDVVAPSGRSLSGDMGDGVEVAHALLPTRQIAIEGQRILVPEDLKPAALSAAEKEADHDQIPENPLALSLPAPAGQTFNLVPRPGSVVTGMLPLDLPRVNASVERFFARIEDLGEELADSHLPLELAPWFATVAAALAASEWVRWQRSRQRALVGGDGGYEYGAVFLAWSLLVNEDNP